MDRLRIPSSALFITLFLTTTTSASLDHHLFARQTGTCFTDYFRCTSPGFPTNFCCPPQSKCIPLAAGTTVLCCPEGGNCDVIAPIVCNIELQDASIRPNATLKTTALTAKLPTCGDRCCPHGYSCNAQNTCSKDANQETAPVPQESSSRSSTLTPTSTGSSPSTATNTASTTSSSSSFPTSEAGITPVPIAQKCPSFPLTAVLIFFFAGLLTGIGLVVVFFCILGAVRRRHMKSDANHDKSIGNISSPRLQDDSGRHEFLLKQPGTPSTLVDRGEKGTSLGRQGTIRRVRSFFSRGGEDKEYEMQHDASGARGRNSVPPVPPLRVNKQTGDIQKRVSPPVTPPQQTYTQYGDIYIGTDDRTATMSSATHSEHQKSGFTPSPLAQNHNRNNNTAGLGINRGSGLGVGGSAIPEIDGGAAAMNRGNPRGGGTGARELLPPPKFANDDRGSEITTISALMEKGMVDSPNGWSGGGNEGSGRKKGHERNASGGVGIAGLPPPGMPYIYKSPTQGYSKG